MATKKQEVSIQSSNYIAFTQTVETSTTNEFLNGLNTSIADFPGNADMTVTTEFNIQGQNLMLTANSVVGYYVSGGTATGLNLIQDGHGVIDILLDDTYAVKRHAYNKQTIIEIKNIPFSKVSIVTTCPIAGGKSLYAGSLTITDGAAQNQIGNVLLYY